MRNKLMFFLWLKKVTIQWIIPRSPTRFHTFLDEDSLYCMRDEEVEIHVTFVKIQ